jgi:hypothetical protein
VSALFASERTRLAGWATLQTLRRNRPGPPDAGGRVHGNEGTTMNRIIWIVGAVVIVLFILGFFGLR